MESTRFVISYRLRMRPSTVRFLAAAAIAFAWFSGGVPSFAGLDETESDRLLRRALDLLVDAWRDRAPEDFETLAQLPGRPDHHDRHLFGTNVLHGEALQ